MIKNEKLEIMLKKLEENKEEWNKLNDGEQRVLRAYRNCISNKLDYLVIDDGWEKEAKEILECIKDCGIKKFLFDDTSTEATKMLMVFIKNGAKITGTEVYKVEEWTFKTEEYEGLVIEL